MYIRRKVFTKLYTESGEERYFSTTKYTMTEDSEGIRYFSKCNDNNSEKDEISLRKGVLLRKLH